VRREVNALALPRRPRKASLSIRAIANRSIPGKELMTNSMFRDFSVAAALLATAVFACCAQAQEEIAPPQGKGHVVVFISGISGIKHEKVLAQAIASLGYDVVAYDGREIAKSPGEGLRTAIQNAQQMPHALPGKVALVGVSLGGGLALAFGSRWPDLVVVDIVWYPATGFVKRIPGFAGVITVPVLMFAGESDHFMRCCLIGTARSLAADAAVANAPFELITYPGVDHDFIQGGTNFSPTAYSDALEHTAAKLKAAFGD
jgi:dienelactone hydrolase